ncbi:hypothetical protein BSZ37_11620 [Rubrivirga marina]|uniref:DUF2851 domain-containing protein n=1 Tax=Rubrivirga marina TaxID=1196024 RepID=A0A271J678_9BACT|nr:hypothetical protein BSZ37_11620 [Rubrivirga marina]
MARVPEAAIQDAWVRGLFDARALRTTDGQRVEVVHLGTLNGDSGPDVRDARVVIGGMLWAGDVEIHTTSAAWEAHGHDRDPAYDRVVLHVVLAADRRTGTLRRADGSALPELVLLPHLDRSLRALLRAFHVEPGTAPRCGARWDEVDPALARSWVRHLGTERLRRRARDLGREYGRQPDLDRLLVRRMFRALGYEANADAFETLATRLPLADLRQRSATGLHAALLFASALQPAELFTETAVADLTPMRPEAWRRGGRPANAPRRRIAQAAAWLAPGGPLRHDPVETLTEALADGVETATDLLRAETPDGSSRLGDARAVRVLVDAVLPVLLLDAEQREDPAREAVVLDAYDRLPASPDRITRRFAELGLRPRTAAEAQGVHQLVRAYCEEGRCARCAIGRALYPALDWV